MKNPFSWFKTWLRKKPKVEPQVSQVPTIDTNAFGTIYKVDKSYKVGMRIPPRTLQERSDPTYDYKYSMGVVTNTTFALCFWPFLKEPTELFAPGSKGLVILGKKPANVVFPSDTKFIKHSKDAANKAEQAVKNLGARNIVDLSPEQSAIWRVIYESEKII